MMAVGPIACGKGIWWSARALIDIAGTGCLATLSKLRIPTSCPSSKIRKSFLVSPYTWFPCRSFTTTGTDTSSVLAWNVGVLCCGSVPPMDNTHDTMTKRITNEQVIPKFGDTFLPRSIGLGGLEITRGFATLSEHIKPLLPVLPPLILVATILLILREARHGVSEFTKLIRIA